MEEPLINQDENDIQNINNTELFFPLHRQDIQLGDFKGAKRTLTLMLAFWIIWLGFVIYNLCTQSMIYKNVLDMYITFEYWFEICTVSWLPLTICSIYANASALC
jgi:hypothetical protein